jgi:hypothetical protein
LNKKKKKQSYIQEIFCVRLSEGLYFGLCLHSGTKHDGNYGKYNPLEYERGEEARSLLRNITIIRARGISAFTALKLPKTSMSIRPSSRQPGSKVNRWEAKCLDKQQNFRIWYEFDIFLNLVFGMLDYGGTLIKSEGVNLGGDLEVNESRTGGKNVR